MNKTNYQSLIERTDSKVQHDDHQLSWGTKRILTKTTYLLIVFQIILLILFGVCGGSEIVTYGTGTQAYNMLIGVEIMMFIGFGYLMTFMRWYGLGAVGFSMLITAIGFQWYVFTDSFWTQWYNNNGNWTYVPVNLYSFVDAMFGVATVLISFGALIGKVSPLQLTVMTIIELCLHALNAKVLMEGVLELADLGGTYGDHMFGAYFGLSVAYVLGAPRVAGPAMGTVADIFSLIGTLFLWIYWPSFVSGAAVPDSEDQQIAMVNTILALSASTIITFCISSLIAHDGRFRPVDVQNATLAGGVAIGATANLKLSPFGAVLIGLVGGVISAFGFNKIQPWLESKGVHDSCGIHNLHAMPSVVGGIASIIVTYSQIHTVGNDLYGKNADSQYWRQALAIVVCMGFAIVSGLITGVILKALGGHEEEQAKEFSDAPYWEVAGDFESTFETEFQKITKGDTLYVKRGEAYNPLHESA